MQNYFSMQRKYLAQVRHKQHATDSSHPCQQDRTLLIKALQPLIREPKFHPTPTEPDSFQPWPKLLQQLRKPTLRLPWCQIPFGHTLLLRHSGDASALKEGREGAREGHSPKWSGCWEERPDWHTNLAQCMCQFYTQDSREMWDVPPASAVLRT